MKHLNKFLFLVLFFTSCSNKEPSKETQNLSKSGYFNFVDKTPIKNKNHINKNIKTLKYIVFHTTGDYSSKINKDNKVLSSKDKYEANRQFFRHYADTVKRIASWHFTVDDSGISQLISLNERGYHSSNKEINESSIGIEMCVNHYKEPNLFRKVLENEKLLIKEILKIYPNIKLIRHHDADTKNHKNCPEIFTDNQWNIIYDFLINNKEISDEFLKNYTKLKVEYKNGKDTQMF